MKLTKSQLDALIHVVDKTQMDTWFIVLYKRIDDNCVKAWCYDADNHRKIPLKRAMNDAVDGFVDLDVLGITADEIACINEILALCKISTRI